jgi:hypothetical protein
LQSKFDRVQPIDDGEFQQASEEAINALLKH